LDKSVSVLQKKLSRDLLARRNDNMRLMQENVALIKEINKLRREIKLMHQVQRQKEISTATRSSAGPSGHMQAGGAGGSASDALWNEAEKRKLSEMQRTQIATLRMQIEEAQARLMHFRPSSRGGASFAAVAPNAALEEFQRRQQQPLQLMHPQPPNAIAVAGK
jgi:hypothetical protein